MGKTRGCSPRHTGPRRGNRTARQRQRLLERYARGFGDPGTPTALGAAISAEAAVGDARGVVRISGLNDQIGVFLRTGVPDGLRRRVWEVPGCVAAGAERGLQSATQPHAPPAVGRVLAVTMRRVNLGMSG